MRKSLCLLVLYWVASSIHIQAQLSEDQFIRYSIRDGLSGNVVHALLQDSKGYIWIGTDAGLNRYDGNIFASVIPNTPPVYLLSGSLSRLKNFGAESIGLLSTDGFQLFNTEANTVHNYVIPDTTAFSTHINTVWDAMDLPDSAFAVSTATGFYVFDKQGQITFRHDAHSLRDIGKKRILYGRDIFKISDQKLLVYVNESGLVEYDHEKKTFLELNHISGEPFAHPSPVGLHQWVVKQQLSGDEFIFINHTPGEVVYYHHPSKRQVKSAIPFIAQNGLNWESKICPLNDSTLLLSHRTNGFYILHLDRKTGKVYCDNQKHLVDYKIMAFLVDQDGRLWVGTTEGLLKQELQSPMIRSFHYPPAPGEKFTGGFTCIYRHQDIIYAGRFSITKGMDVINAKDMSLLKEIHFGEPLSQWNELRSIEMYHPDTLWIGTNSGILWYDTRSGKYGEAIDIQKHPWAKDFYPVLAPARKDGYAWMCSVLDGKVVRYHIPTRTFTLFTTETNPALPYDRVKNVVYDAYGDVWVSGHSLARWNDKLQLFDTLITSYGGQYKFNDNILTIVADDRGSLWFHNSINGLLEYKIKERAYNWYSIRDGLPSNLIYSLSEVRDGQLWMAGINHLTTFDIDRKKFTVFNMSDGLPEQNPTSRRIYFDAAADQYIVGCGDYLVTYPRAPEKRPDYGGQLIVQEVMVDQDKKYFPPLANLVLRPQENNVSISFTVVDFEKSNYQFAYRINNTGHWNPIGNQRSINLTHLPPGSYSVQLRASGKPGVEKTNTVFFTIRSPFWKTPWFLGLLITTIGVTIYLVVRKRISRIRQKANLDRLLSQTEMKALQAQMNPHFIFNSLNSIGEMILNNENQQASNYLSKFARLIRMTLEQSSQSLVTLRNTIDYLERYMEMENIRNHQFTHEVVIDDDLDEDDTLVPPMLIQPFIENALWHGLPASRKDIHVRIHFRREGENLVCEIEDNGIGILAAQKSKIENNGRHQSHGISNIQNRVALLNEKYNMHCEVRIKDKQEITGHEGHGTQVTLRLPLELKES